MSKSTKHAYKIVESSHNSKDLQIGGILIDKNHVRKEDEPYRTWEFVNLETMEETGTVVGKHLGEYEKVKELLLEDRG